ncbi:TetR/AcrR family transcriptional regulator [Nocardia puris]|uniref:TetR family transcriptional regulator n=1 Tax=Nocardia puris TaxID=208602 RepID=A0A366DUQ9_9NOCA|nr:TetR/AcrR family transcriptional regulator C-terminal domain-containing protein [Nocardia puris]RBO93645.1 TetR family transcriptional regulator [Nocardia puris]
MPRTVWLRDQGPPRKPRLSRERIVSAAMDLLDAEGVDGFSMRRLAARLDAGTMSLYAYVETREDVLDLALHAAFAEIDRTPDDANAPWRELLTRQLTRSREVMRRHPWIPVLTATRPLLGPNALARSELFYAALARAGLSGAPLLAAVGALSYYVSGFVASENVWRATMRDSDDEKHLRRDAQAHIDERADRYPALSAHAHLEFSDFDESFALGLNIVLDGIEAQLPR